MKVRLKVFHGGLGAHAGDLIDHNFVARAFGWPPDKGIDWLRRLVAAGNAEVTEEAPRELGPEANHAAGGGAA